MKVTCSTCGGEVSFQSRASIFGVCRYCKSMLVRSDVSVESIGKMSEIPRDMSPLQVGTRGTLNAKQFEIVGRQRVAWSSGSWNEWYLYFENGKTAWLADAQGANMVSFQTANELSCDAVRKLKVSDSIELQSTLFTINDIREVRSVASEGELPVLGDPGRQYLNLDLTGPSGTFASLVCSDDEVLSYIGNFIEFDELSLQNLRKLDGW